MIFLQGYKSELYFWCTLGSCLALAYPLYNCNVHFGGVVSTLHKSDIMFVSQLFAVQIAFMFLGLEIAASSNRSVISHRNSAIACPFHASLAFLPPSSERRPGSPTRSP